MTNMVPLAFLATVKEYVSVIITLMEIAVKNAERDFTTSLIVKVKTRRKSYSLHITIKLEFIFQV